MTTNKICGNCEYDKEDHSLLKEGGFLCPLGEGKKFKPSPNHSPKGCGKIFEYKRKGIHITGACGDTGYTDGFIPLCEECKNG